MRWPWILLLASCATAPTAPNAQGRRLVGNWVYGDPGKLCVLAPAQPNEPTEQKGASASEMLVLGEGGAYLRQVKQTTEEGDWRLIAIDHGALVVVLRPEGATTLDSLLCRSEPAGETVKITMVNQDRIDLDGKTFRRCYLP